jgi:hypothetical protein
VKELQELLHIALRLDVAFVDLPYSVIVDVPLLIIYTEPLDVLETHSEQVSESDVIPKEVYITMRGKFQKHCKDFYIVFVGKYHTVSHGIKLLIHYSLYLLFRHFFYKGVDLFLVTKQRRFRIREHYQLVSLNLRLLAVYEVCGLRDSHYKASATTSAEVFYIAFATHYLDISVQNPDYIFIREFVVGHSSNTPSYNPQ